MQSLTKRGRIIQDCAFATLEQAVACYFCFSAKLTMDPDPLLEPIGTPPSNIPKGLFALWIWHSYEVNAPVLSCHISGGARCCRGTILLHCGVDAFTGSRGQPIRYGLEPLRAQYHSVDGSRPEVVINRTGVDKY